MTRFADCYEGRRRAAPSETWTPSVCRGKTLIKKPQFGTNSANPGGIRCSLESGEQIGSKGGVKLKAQSSDQPTPLPPPLSRSFEKFLEGSVDCDHRQAPTVGPCEPQFDA